MKHQLKHLMSIATLLVGVIFCVTVAHAETLSEHGAWTVFKTSEGGSPVCFAGSEPEKDEGDYTKRGDIYVLVTHRPTVKELDVISIEAGYDYQKGEDVTVKIGGATFKLFTSGSNAWAKDSATDKKIANAMKKGSAMVVTGKSWRGTKTKDTYSLTGFTAAYNAARKACGL